MARAGLRPTHIIDELLLVDEFRALIDDGLHAIQQPPPKTNINGGMIEPRVKLNYARK
jgi:hypothetical protein